jgi:class 3 adenylate cyclase
MTRKRQELAVLFADIANSSQLYENLGDSRALEVVSDCFARLSGVAERHQGSVVKTIGDAVLCRFPTAVNAVLAALNMQQALQGPAFPGVGPSNMPCIYIGIHTGPVMRFRQDIFGETVNLASRLMTLAKPRQILISEATLENLDAGFRTSVRFMGIDRIKGFSEAVKIYEYLWEVDDATLLLDRRRSLSARPAMLELKYGNQKRVVDDRNPNLTLGRQGHNDMIVDYVRVSRSHARIEYRHHRFVLIDHSSNGSFVDLTDGSGIFVRRDETLLTGKGTISLGRKATPGSPGAIHYAVKN